MLEQKRRLTTLIILMVLIASSLSLVSSFLMYETAFEQQKFRLNELVQSQASLSRNLILHYKSEDKDHHEKFDLNEVIRLLAKSQQEFKIYSKSGEFTVGYKVGDTVRFLIVNGKIVSSEESLWAVPLDSKQALPMKLALKSEEGTVVGLDYKNRIVLAAYTPVEVDGFVLGMVAKIDMNEIKGPFIRANIDLFLIGMVLIFFGIIFFRRFGDPIVEEIKQSEKEYRGLVESVQMIILKINFDGDIIFANDFAHNFFKGPKESTSLLGKNVMDVLSCKCDLFTFDNLGTGFMNFFGRGAQPQTQPYKCYDGPMRWVSWTAWEKKNEQGVVEEFLCIGRDITEKHEAQLQLQSSEEQYRNIFGNAPLAMVHFAHSGTILNCNNIFVEMMGSSREKVIGFNTAEESAPAMRVALRKALAGKKSSFEDVYTSVTGGRTMFLRAIFNPIIRPNAPIEVIATLEDITESHKIQNALEESEERFRVLASASPVGMIITDRKGIVSYANDQILEMTGDLAENLIGSRWTDKIVPADRDVVLKEWNGFDSRADKHIEVRLQSESENAIWVICQKVGLQYRADDRDFVITFTDISKLKEAELQQKKLIAAIEQSVESIIITDTAGCIVYVNPAFESISGYSQKEVLGRNPHFLKSGEQKDPFYADLWKTIAAGNIWRGKFVNIAKDGSRFTQEATICPVRDEEGSIVNFVGVSRDISEQLIVEAQLRQAQKLESIGELAAGIAHEINTPTQYVSTNVKFLEDSFADLIKMLTTVETAFSRLEKGDDLQEVINYKKENFDYDDFEYLAEDVPKAIEESDQGLKNIARIVRSIKQLAHPGEKHKSFFCLNQIVEDAVTVSTNEWKYVAEVDLNLEADLPKVQCMKSELGQVVLNLVVNSAHAIEAKGADASGAKGHIKITTGYDGDFALLTVCDDGIGMPPEVVARAFDPFFTTKEVGKGTGQGLAIAHNVIVNVHKGSITIDSVEGEGTTFTVRIPFSEREEKSRKS